MFGEQLRSDYEFYKYSNENGYKVALLADLDKGSVSVTNDIENVANDLKVEHIIYRDSRGIIDYWGKEKGFESLGEKDFTIAIDKAREKGIFTW